MNPYRPYRILQPPRTLRRRGVQLDNVALVPASLLPFRREWQAIANHLPTGSVLLCPRTDNRRQRQLLERIATSLRRLGHRVVTIPAEQVAPMT